MVLTIGVSLAPFAAQSDDGWGQWEVNPSDGGTTRKWTGGYKHCAETEEGAKQAFVWECRPCEGAARGWQHYCWVGYAFTLMVCRPPSEEQNYRVETHYRKTQKRCGPVEQAKTVTDGDRYKEVTARDDVSSNGTPETVPVEQPPADSGGPKTADGSSTVPEDPKSFHKQETDQAKKEAEEKSKTDNKTQRTTKTVTPSVAPGQTKRPRKEVQKTTSAAKSKKDNGQTSSSNISPEAAGAIGTAVGIGVGVGMGMGGGMRGGRDDMR